MAKRVYSYQSQQFAGVVELNPETQKKRIKMSAPALYQHFLDTYCKVGDQTTLNITDKRPKRSALQNNYFFLYLSLISLSSGHSIKELECWVKGKFLSKGITEVFGDKTRIVKSHRELNISEFMELLEQIEEAAGIPLPDTTPFLKPLSHEEYAKLKDKQREIYERLVVKIKLST